MPNHVSNLLVITGKPEFIKALLEKVKGPEDDFSLNSIIPMPEELNVGEKWYDWRCSRWGTKWDCYEVSVNASNPFFKESGNAQINFQTAWSPPTPVIRTLSAMFPDVGITHYFEDEGGCFSPGYEDWVDGEKVNEMLYDVRDEKEHDKWKQLEIFGNYEDWLEWKKECESEGVVKE